ncbi:MAG: hypothetical protein JXQ90_02790 [Cyclobacteriaceae bacterium]
MKILKTLTYLLLFGLLSCGEDEPVIEDINDRLVSFREGHTRAAGLVQGTLGAFNLDLPLEKVVYPVKSYVVDYETEFMGETITVSGMAYIPDSLETPFPFLSFQHGTIADNASAPTQLFANNTQHIIYSAMAGAGFIVFVPDFVGFGASVDLMHPYYVEEPSAAVVVDGLRAAYDLTEELGITTSPKTYLAGYSQGGYVTMAAHKYFEEQEVDYFELKASFPSSGGYELNEMLSYFQQLDVYDQPFFLAYIAESYRQEREFSTDVLSSVFNSPYDDLVVDVFDGQRNGGQINKLLNDTISVLLTDKFINNSSSEELSDITEELEENSLLGWTPGIPMYMYHGDADVTVPFYTSTLTYDHFVENGSTVMSFQSFEGATHYTGFLPYLETFLKDLVEVEGLR